MYKTNATSNAPTVMLSVAVLAIPTVNVNGNSIKYIQSLLQRFGVIYMAIVITLGFIGNSVSCYVFVRSKLK
jgi:predicted tellurium resistance membrane protein TerC